MLNEAGSKAHSKSAIEAMEIGDEDDFASMFEASIKEEKGGNIVEGVIVADKPEENSI